MSLINLKFRNSTLQFISDEEEKLRSLAEIVEAKAQKIAGKGQNVSDLKICYTLCLKLEDELDTLKANANDNSKNETLSDEVVGSAIMQVAEYINVLADRFENK